MPKASKTQLASQKKVERPAKTKKSSKVSKPSKQRDAPVDAKPLEIATPEILKRLADNEEQIRLDTVNSLSNLLLTKRKFDKFDIQKLWKGLWFAMWHSDTPQAQQTLARNLADLFAQVQNSNLPTFIESFWLILIREWDTLDRYRVNKYYMLVRLVLNAQLSRLASQNWNEVAVVNFKDQLVDETTGPLSYKNVKTPHGLRLHLVDIYVDEVAKVKGESELDPSILSLVLSPVLSQAEYSEFKHIRQRVKDEVLTDERLVEWNVVEQPEEPAATAEVDEVDSDWDGFD